MWGWPWVDRRIRVGRMRREGGREGATADLEMAVQFVCRWPVQEQDRPWAGISDITASSLECCSFQLFPHSHLHFLYQSHVSISIGSNIFYIIRRRKKKSSGASGLRAEGQTFHTSFPALLFPSWDDGVETPPTPPPPPPHTRSTAVLLYTTLVVLLSSLTLLQFSQRHIQVSETQRKGPICQGITSLLRLFLEHDFFEPACDIECNAPSLLHSALQLVCIFQFHVYAYTNWFKWGMWKMTN